MKMPAFLSLTVVEKIAHSQGLKISYTSGNNAVNVAPSPSNSNHLRFPDQAPSKFMLLPVELQLAIVQYLGTEQVCALRFTSRDMRTITADAFKACFYRVGVYLGKASLTKLVRLSQNPNFSSFVRELAIYDWRLCRAKFVYERLNSALKNMNHCYRVCVQSTRGHKFDFTDCGVTYGRTGGESLRQMLWPTSSMERSKLLPHIVGATTGTAVKTMHFAVPKLLDGWTQPILTIPALLSLPIRAQSRYSLTKFTLSFGDEWPEPAPKMGLQALRVVLLLMPKLKVLALYLEKWWNLARRPSMDPFNFDILLRDMNYQYLERFELQASVFVRSSTVVPFLQRHAKTLSTLKLGHLTFSDVKDVLPMYHQLLEMPGLNTLSLFQIHTWGGTILYVLPLYISCYAYRHHPCVRTFHESRMEICSEDKTKFGEELARNISLAYALYEEEDHWKFVSLTGGECIRSK